MAWRPWWLAASLVVAAAAPARPDDAGGAADAPKVEAAAPVDPAEAREAEIVFWHSVDKADTPELYAAYLARYGDAGLFSLIAKGRVAALSAETLDAAAAGGGDGADADGAPAVPEPEGAAADARERFAALDLTRDERERLARALVRFGFLDLTSITEADLDFLENGRLVKAVADFQASRGARETGYLGPDQVLFLASLKVPMLPAEEEASWDFGGYGEALVVGRIEAAAAAHGYRPRRLGKLDAELRAELRKLQRRWGMAPTGRLSASFFERLIAEPAAYDPRSEPADAMFGRWSFTLSSDATLCRIWTTAAAVEGRYLGAALPRLMLWRERNARGDTLGADFSELGGGDSYGVIERGGEAKMTAGGKAAGEAGGEAALDYGSKGLTPGPEDGGWSDAAMRLMARAATVTVVARSRLGGELAMRYEVTGFAEAFGHMDRLCGAGRLQNWIGSHAAETEDSDE